VSKHKKNRVAKTVEKQGNLVEANPGKNNRMMHCKNNILHITYDYGSKKRGGKPLPEK
jgi:hypothetical protein